MNSIHAQNIILMRMFFPWHFQLHEICNLVKETPDNCGIFKHPFGCPRWFRREESQIAPLVSSNTWTSPSMYINLLITHKTSNLIQNSPSASRYFSDHASVICDLTMKRPASQVMTILCKKLRSIDMDGFRDNLGSSGLCRADFSQCHAPLDLDHLVDDYEAMSSIIRTRPQVPKT